MKTKSTSLAFLLSAAFMLTGCGTVAFSPTGQVGPALDHPIPTTNSVLVVSALGGTANVFNFGSFSDGNTLTITNLPFNAALAQSAATQAQALGYSAQVASMSADNPLFEDAIESTSSQAYSFFIAPATLSGPNKGSLTDTAKQALMKLNTDTQAKTIVLIAKDTYNSGPFFIGACDKQGKISISNTYMIYLIDGQTYQILAWEEATPNTTQTNSPLCKNINSTTTAQIETTLASIQNFLNNMVRQTVKNLFTLTGPS